MTYTLTEIEPARAMKALAEPTRLQIVSVLAFGPAVQKDLQAVLARRGLSVHRSVLCHHMRKLCAAGLVTRQQRGIWVTYSLVEDMFSAVAEMLRAGR